MERPTPPPVVAPSDQPLLPRPDAGPDPIAESTTAPAARPPRWSGRKTAVAAVLAIGVATAGTAAASTAFPPGAGAGGLEGPGGRGGQARQAPDGQGQPWQQQAPPARTR